MGYVPLPHDADAAQVSATVAAELVDQTVRTRFTSTGHSSNTWADEHTKNIGEAINFP